jgi:hypothetical protein
LLEGKLLGEVSSGPLFTRDKTKTRKYKLNLFMRVCIISVKIFIKIGDLRREVGIARQVPEVF